MVKESRWALGAVEESELVEGSLLYDEGEDKPHGVRLFFGNGMYLEVDAILDEETDGARLVVRVVRK